MRNRERFGTMRLANIKRSPQRGEIWIADMGMAVKTRPVLVLYYPSSDSARALAIVAPLTSQIRGLSGEVDITHIKWLPKPSAINMQGLASIDKNSLTQKIGVLVASDYEAAKAELRALLNL